VAELVSTIGLFVVLQLINSNKNLNPAVIIPIYIGPAIFYTSSTAFVNPSITLTRTLSDTFTGISPASVPLFLLAQLLGAIIGVFISKGLIDAKK
jgi:glycerol uptake facilitator-like aquaporin